MFGRKSKKNQPQQDTQQAGFATQQQSQQFINDPLRVVRVEHEQGASVNYHPRQPLPAAVAINNLIQTTEPVPTGHIEEPNQFVQATGSASGIQPGQIRTTTLPIQYRSDLPVQQPGSGADVLENTFYEGSPIPAPIGNLGVQGVNSQNNSKVGQAGSTHKTPGNDTDNNFDVTPFGLGPTNFFGMADQSKTLEK